MATAFNKGGPLVSCADGGDRFPVFMPWRPWRWVVWLAGAQAGVTAALPPAACIATGVTICFGGVLRDVLCRRDVAIGGQSYALATAMGASAYVGMRELVVRGVMRIPLLMRIGVAYTVTVLERIFGVWYDDASDSFLEALAAAAEGAHQRRSEEEPRRRTTEVKRRFTERFRSPIYI